MCKYYAEIEIDEEYPTVKELAERLAHDYGILSFRGKAHEDMVRAFLENDLKEHGRQRLIKNSTPRVYVYENEDALLDFADELLPLLEDNRAVSIGLKDCRNGTIKYWRVYWNEGLVIYRGRPRNIDFTLKKYLYSNGVFKEMEIEANKKAA